MCLWTTRVRGVTVCGRKVYLSDTGLRLGYRGPTVEVERFLADLDPIIANAIRQAMPVIIAHHQRRMAAETAAVDEAELSLPDDPGDEDDAELDEAIRGIGDVLARPGGETDGAAQ
jgi:hypothetical protein